MPGWNSATTAAMSSGGRRCRSNHNAPLDHAPGFEEHVQLRVELDVGRQRLDLLPHRREVEDVACRDPGTHHVDHARAGVFGHPVVERDARQVDHLVGDLRGDDLAAQAMPEDLGLVALLQHLGEVAKQVGLEVRVVGELRTHHLGHVDALRVRQHDGELGSRETHPAGLAFGDLLVGRQELERSVEPAFGLQHVQVSGMDVDHRERLPAGDGKREGLGAVVVEHQLGDLVGHLDEQLVALFDRHRLLGHHGTEEDLDVDLVVAAVDAGRVVDRVGVDQAHR